MEWLIIKTVITSGNEDAMQILNEHMQLHLNFDHNMFTYMVPLKHPGNALDNISTDHYHSGMTLE